VFNISVLVNVAKYVFTHAVVGTLEELSAVDKEEDMIGFVEKVVGPVKIVDPFNDPMVSVPPDKLDPRVNADV
jgi:rRNA processing protein Gar1